MCRPVRHACAVVALAGILLGARSARATPGRGEASAAADLELTYAAPAECPSRNEFFGELMPVSAANTVSSVATPAGSCTYGRHEATSDGPFMVYVWGVDVDASHGFLAGAGSRPTTPYKIEVR